MQDPCSQSARALAAAIEAGDLTAEAVTAAHLESIEAREPAVQAWAHLVPEQALAEARAIRAPGKARCTACPPA